MASLQMILIFVFNGIVMGTIYFLIAIGLTIIFGMMGVKNFAHGALYAIGAYVAYTITEITGSFWLALVSAPIALFMIGSLMEKVCIRRLRDAAQVYYLLLTFGLALVIQEVIIIIWGSHGKPMTMPAILTGMVDFGSFAYPKYRVFLVCFTALIGFLTWFFIMRTSLGAKIRAGSEDREMTSCVGIDIPKLNNFVFAIGAAIAGIAGVLAAPMVGLEPFMGMNILILSFVVVVVGGLGSFFGSLIGALLVGISQSLCILFFPPAASVIVFAFMAVVLIVRPQGLLGKI